MRIVVANNYYYLRGGSEKVMLSEMQLLKEEQHEVVPFSRQYNLNLPTNFSHYFPRDIKYINTSLLNKLHAASKMLYALDVKNKFQQLLTTVKPNIVHAHNIYGRLSTSLLDVAKNNSIPVVLTLHDYKLICPAYLMLNHGQLCQRCIQGDFYNCLLTKCHKNSYLQSAIYTWEAYLNKYRKQYDSITFFLCPSKFILKQHLASGIDPKRLLYLPNFVNTLKYQPNFAPGDYILFSGRIAPEKGILTLLKAVTSLNIKLKIAGAKTADSRFNELIASNSSDQVEFLGYQTETELQNLYSNAAFVVLPSENYENAPMTVLEAFAYGKPVIASNIGGIPELVSSNETGLLFTPGNYLELRDKIALLKNNHALTRSLGKNARNKIETEFNAQKHYAQLINIYNMALK